jgi:glucose/arabinose dehydrogenase
MRAGRLAVPLACAFALVGGATPARAATLPAGFVDEKVVSIPSPTALAFAPDGRQLFTSQDGVLRVRQRGVLKVALDLRSVACSDGERGLLGVAVDPNFASNGFIYLYYTFKKSGSCPTNVPTAPVNRVARFTLPSNSVIDPGSQLVLIDNIPSPNGNHNAGDLTFSKAGNLFISVGDGGCDYLGGGCGAANDAARDRNVLLGKVLRITPSGGIPSGNPYLGANSARCNATGMTTADKRCQETFAWGLRNPFRVAVNPNGTGSLLYINDVGQSLWEEIDRGQAGADYGWNVREGHCATGSATNCGAPPAGMVNPIFDYSHASGCRAITGGSFVPNGAWPTAYDSAYLFGDYICGKIFRLVPNGAGGFSSVDFGTFTTGGPIHMAFGPRGSGGKALYYTTYAGGGEVRRVAYVGS